MKNMMVHSFALAGTSRHMTLRYVITFWPYCIPPGRSSAKRKFIYILGVFGHQGTYFSAPIRKQFRNLVSIWIFETDVPLWFKPNILSLRSRICTASPLYIIIMEPVTLTGGEGEPAVMIRSDDERNDNELLSPVELVCRWRWFKYNIWSMPPADELR